MQDDVLSQIAGMREIEDVLVLTHNIDLMFVQTAFLSALKKCGHPNLTILADAQCVFDSYRFQYAILSGLGTRYRVLPVPMNGGMRFHPKAIFLKNRETAALYVGSGNLTFGGMRENAEVWSRISVENDPAKISGFLGYLDAIIPLLPFSEDVRRDLEDLLSSETNPWIEQLPAPDGIWFSPGAEESLLDYIVNRVSSRQPTRLTVCTPYFDSAAQALRDLVVTLGGLPTDVLIQSGKSTLVQASADSLPSHVSIKSVRALRGGDRSNRFVHAKWYAVECADGVEFFHGSANCSRAALTSGSNFGNAELMVSSTLSTTEFQERVLADLEVDSTPPLLPHVPADDDNVWGSGITIVAAKFEYGRLRIAYSHLEDVEISELIADSISVAFEIRREGELSAEVSHPPRDVVLRGVRDNCSVESNHLWVDDESKLGSSARIRGIAEVIRGTQNDDGHDPNKWLLIFNLVGKDMNELTAHETHRSREMSKVDGGKISTTVLSLDDYFTFKPLPSHHASTAVNVSIQSLLMKLFGIENDYPETIERDEDNNEDEQAVDRPVVVPAGDAAKPSVKTPSEREKQRLAESASKIVDRLCQVEYLLGRDPRRLGLDLSVVSLLLRKAYSLGWLDKPFFHRLSHQVWSNLFFHTKGHKGRGLLEVRAEGEADLGEFVHRLVSPMLVASLYAWFSAVSYDPVDLYSRRFRLSQIVAMGRCPWLWRFDEAVANQIAENLKQIWADSPCGESLTPDQLFVKFSSELDECARLGSALAKMESKLGTMPIDEVRSRAAIVEVVRGDLLWQGSKGFCLAVDDANERDRIQVLSLQDPASSNQFLTKFLIPMGGLVREIGALCPELSVEEIEAIRHFVFDFQNARLT